MASRRQQRKTEKERRHIAKDVRVLQPGEPVELLVYTREQAAQILGISLATLDRRVIPAIATIKTEWGARLIPKDEIDRYLAERTDESRARPKQVVPSGRRSAVPPDVVDRIRRQRAGGASLAEIARRLNRDGIPTGQGGRQWWPSTVRAVLLRRDPSIHSSARRAP
jgi:Recombinase